MDLIDVLKVMTRDAEQAWQYRDLCDGDIDESDRLGGESDQARASVIALAEAAHAAYELLATVQPTHRTTHDLKQALARIGDNA